MMKLLCSLLLVKYALATLTPFADPKSWFTTFIEVTYFSKTRCGGENSTTTSFGEDDLDDDDGLLWQDDVVLLAAEEHAISVIAHGSYCRKLNLTHQFIDLWHSEANDNGKHAAYFYRLVYDQHNPTCDITLNNVVKMLPLNITERRLHRCELRNEAYYTHNDMTKIDLSTATPSSLPWQKWGTGSLFLAFADDQDRTNDYEHAADMCQPPSAGRVLIQWWLQPDLCLDERSWAPILSDDDHNVVKPGDNWDSEENHMQSRFCNAESMHTELYQHRNVSIDGACFTDNMNDKLRTGRAILPYCHHYEQNDDEFQMAAPGDTWWNDDVYARSNDDYDDSNDDENGDDDNRGFSRNGNSKDGIGGNKAWNFDDDDEYMEASIAYGMVVQRSVISKSGCCTSDVSKCYSYRSVPSAPRDYSFNGPVPGQAASAVSLGEVTASSMKSTAFGGLGSVGAKISAHMAASERRFAKFVDERSNGGEHVNSPSSTVIHFVNVSQSYVAFVANVSGVSNTTTHDLTHGTSEGVMHLNLNRLLELSVVPIYFTHTNRKVEAFYEKNKQVNFAKCGPALIRGFDDSGQLHFAFGCFDDNDQASAFETFFVDTEFGLADNNVTWFGDIIVNIMAIFPSGNVSDNSVHDTRPFVGDAEIRTLLSMQELSGKVQVTYRSSKNDQGDDGDDTVGDALMQTCGNGLKIHELHYTTDSCRPGGSRIANILGSTDVSVSNVCDSSTNRMYFGAWSGESCSGDLMKHVTQELRSCSNRAWYLNDDATGHDDGHDDGNVQYPPHDDDDQEKHRHSDDDYDDYRLSDDDLTQNDMQDLHNDDYLTVNHARFNLVQCCTSNLERCFPYSWAPTSAPITAPTKAPARPTVRPTKAPIGVLTPSPSVSPSIAPTRKPTSSPVLQPTPGPTAVTATQTKMMVAMTINYISTDFQSRRRLLTSVQFQNDQTAQTAACQAVLLSIGNVYATCAVGTIGADDTSITPTSFPVEFKITVILEQMAEWNLGTSSVADIVSAMLSALQLAVTSGAYSSYYTALTGNVLLVNDEIPVTASEPTVTSDDAATTSIVLPAVVGGVGGFLLILLIIFLVMRQRAVNSQQQVHMVQMVKR